MIRVCPDKDARCPNGIECNKPCAKGHPVNTANLEDGFEFHGIKLKINNEVPEGKFWVVREYPPLMVDGISGREIDPRPIKREDVK